MDPRLARRSLAAALAIGIAADLLLDRNALGINVPLLTLAALAAVALLGRARRPADALDAWLPAVAIAASIGPALRTDPTVVALDLVLVALATSAWGFAMGGVAVTRQAFRAVAWMGVQAGIAVVGGLAWLVSRAAAGGGLSRGTQQLGRFAPVLRGMLLAIPVLFGFAVLLGSADAVFAQALDDALRLPIDVDDLVARAAFALIAAAIVAGPLALAAGPSGLLTTRADLDEVLDGGAGPGAPPPPSAQRTPQSRSHVEVVVVLVAVNALFAWFAAVQVRYLFGGTDTLAAVGMSYSDYARQGYFQLAAVVALAGLLLIGAYELAGRTRAVLAAGLVLLLLTGVILASAAFRLRLYQEAYGWTELRFFVAASLAWLAAAVGLAIVLLLADRMRWVAHGLAVAAVAVTLAVSVIGPQQFVIEQNLARVLNPSLVAPGGESGIDLGYGMRLGDDAVPALVAALDVVPLDQRPALLAQLRQRRLELQGDPDSASWFSWNLARERARAALAGL